MADREQEIRTVLERILYTAQFHEAREDPTRRIISTNWLIEVCEDALASQPTDDRVGEGRHERWSFWQCSHCGFVKTYPHPPAGPGKPVCTYGHDPQSMLEVLVRAALNPSAPDRESE